MLYSYQNYQTIALAGYKVRGTEKAIKYDYDTCHHSVITFLQSQINPYDKLIQKVGKCDHNSVN